MLGLAIICLIVSSIFLPLIKADLGLDLRVRSSSQILYSSVHLRSRAYDGATNVGGIEVLGVGFFDLPADIYLEDGEYTVVGSGGIFDGNKYAFDKWEGPVANPSEPATTLSASGEVTLTLVLFKWDFDLDVSPSSNTVRQGDGALYEVTVTATGDWTTETGENVRVQVEILNTPLGITKNFAGSFMLSQSNPSDTHACTIYTSETDTPTGTYSITFEGTIESTTTTHSKTVDLVVEPKEGPPPDLIIEDFWWSPENPQPGDEVTFTYVEKNQGKGDASAHRNTLLIDDIPISNDVVEALAAGAPRTRTFPDKWIATSGAHDALVKADDQNGVTESDEENNFREETIGEKKQVSTSLTIDLAPSSIPPNTIIGITISGRLTRIDKGTGIPDRPIRLDWTGGLTTVTTNADGYYSYPTDVGPYEEGTYEFTASFEHHETPSAIFLPSTGSNTLSVGKIATEITISLTHSTVEPNTETDMIINGRLTTVDGDAGLGQKTIELTYGWGASSSTTTNENGYYSKSVSVSLSSGSYLVTASFEENSVYAGSTASETLQVTEGAPDLIITNISWNPSDPIVGDSVAFSYIIENEGTSGTGDFTTALYIDGERVDISVRASLAAGKTQTRSFTYVWTATEGSHEIKVVADDLNEISESKEDNNQMVVSTLVLHTLDSVASQYAKSDETYRILNVKVGNNPYSVIIYYPSSTTSPLIEDLTGAVVVDGSNLTPLIASQDPTKNFLVNSSLTLALAKMRGWSAPDPNYWVDLNVKASEAYLSLLVMFGGVKALWITVEFAVTGGVSAATIATKIVEIADFALEQVDTLERIGGVTDAIHNCADLIVFGKDIYSGYGALKTVYEAYELNDVISVNQMIEHANKLAYMKTATFAIHTTAKYAFEDDIGGMATSWLEAGAYTKTLEGISRQVSTIVDSMVDDTVTPPQIYLLLASQVEFARFALLTWSAMTNMYQNIVNRGVFNVWYWLLDAPNSLKHYQQLYDNWLSVLADYEKRQEDFYEAIDRLFQQSVERVLTEDSSSLNMLLAENANAIFLITFFIACVCMQSHNVLLKNFNFKYRRKASD